LPYYGGFKSKKGTFYSKNQKNNIKNLYNSKKSHIFASVFGVNHGLIPCHHVEIERYFCGAWDDDKIE